MGVIRPPLRVAESDGTPSVRPVNVIAFNSADFVVVDQGGATVRIDAHPGAGASLTDTFIGFGDSSNLLTGSANFTFTEESGGTGPTMLLTGDKPQITIQDDTDATDYKTKLIQSGASLYHYSADSTGTNNEMARYAQNYIAFQRSMTANVGIGTVPASGVALHIKDDESDNDNVVVRIQDSSVNTVGDQVAIEGYWNTAQAGVIYFELRDTTTAASAIVMEALNDAGSLTEFVRMDGNAKAITFNEQSEDVDFRVETENADSTLRIVGSTDNVGIQCIPDSSVQLEVKNSISPGSASIVRLSNSNTSMPNDTKFGAVEFYNADASGAGVGAEIQALSNGSGRGGQLDFLTGSSGGSQESKMFIDESGVVTISNTASSTTTTGVEKLHVVGTGSADPTVLIESTSTDLANEGPQLELYRAANLEDNDKIGVIRFSGQDDAGNKTEYGRIEMMISDETTPGEDGEMIFYLTEAGSIEQEYFRIRGGSRQIEFNTGQDDIDFVINSDTVANFFFMDASQNNASFGGTLPVSGGATLQIPDNTISHYCNVNTIRSDAVGLMVMVNEDNQGQMWVHDSASAHTINLVEPGVKGMHFQFMSTDGNITIDPQGSDTLNGGTASLTRSTNYEIYDVFCYANGKWALSNPA